MNLLTNYLINNLSLTQNQADNAVENFKIYRYLLLETNKQFNLTSITDPYEIEIKHFIDSITAFKYINGSVLDVGAGAGFPSLPLAIICLVTNKQNKFTAVDSLNKRVNFLNNVISTLKLTNCTALHSRAEDLSRSTKFDTVVARAVAPLNTLCEYTLPFVSVGGFMIAYKGKNSADEITSATSALTALGAKLEGQEEFTLPNGDNRSLILIKKIKDCNIKYPRGKNLPKLSPL